MGHPMNDAANSHQQLYVALLTHDISNYNQTTRGYLEMLLDEQLGPITDEQARVLTTCLRQCRRIQSLIDAIRLLEQLVRTAPATEPLDLDEVIRDTILAVQREYSDRDIRVRFIPAHRQVLAEPQLSVVFHQLLSNATRHNDSEVVEIDLHLSKSTSEPPMWRILVADNGNGVPPAKRDLVFGRLENEQVHGAGLGLSLTRALVTRWGGEIWLEQTDEGQGAIFGLTLPCVP
jgi:signal transduction histidine kinase